MTTVLEPSRPAPTPPTAPGDTGAGTKPLTTGKQPGAILVALWSFVALLAAVPVAWGWGLSWLDITLAVLFYCISGLGIGTGFHRYLTHGSFKAKRWLRVTLAVAGTSAIEGSAIQWVADHRRHHAY